MDEHQKKLGHRHEGRPRKVRFKISSSYSGRVLKQVYEDGQELEPPAKEHSRRFLRHSFEPGDRFCGAGEAPENRFHPPATLTARRISIFREDTELGLTSRSPLPGGCQPSHSRCPVSAGHPATGRLGTSLTTHHSCSSWQREPQAGTPSTGNSVLPGQGFERVIPVSGPWQQRGQRGASSAPAVLPPLLADRPLSGLYSKT